MPGPLARYENEDVKVGMLDAGGCAPGCAKQTAEYLGRKDLHTGAPDRSTPLPP